MDSHRSGIVNVKAWASAWIPVCVLILIAHAIVTAHAFSTTGPQTKFPMTSDTIAYLRMTDWPILNPGFLTGERAFIYALLLKATAKNLAVAGYAQMLFSLSCWGFLAWSSLRLMTTSMGKVLIFGLVLLCAVREEVMYWNSISLSESISISFFALWIGSWIMFAYGSHGFWRLFPLITSFPFAFVRDSNVILILLAAVLFTLVAASHLAKRWTLLITIVLVIFSAGSLVSRSLSFRPRYTLQNNIGGRILVDAWRTAELQNLGLPRTLTQTERANLAGRCGERASDVADVLSSLGSTGVRDLGSWIGKSGQRAYLSFLLRNPGYLFFQPLREDGVLKFLFPLASWVTFKGCSQPLRAEMLPKFHTLFPGWLTRFIRGESPFWFLMPWAIIAMAALVAFIVDKPFRRNAILPIALLLTAIPHHLVIWHGDALDVPRHDLLVGIQVHLAFAIAFALAGEALTIRQMRRNAPRSDGTRGVVQIDRQEDDPVSPHPS